MAEIQIRPYLHYDILLTLLVLGCQNGYVYEAKTNRVDRVGSLLNPRGVGKNAYNDVLEKAVEAGFFKQGSTFDITDAGRAELARYVSAIQPTVTDEEMLAVLDTQRGHYFKFDKNLTTSQFEIRSNQILLTAVRHNLMRSWVAASSPDSLAAVYFCRNDAGAAEVNLLKTTGEIAKLSGQLRTVELHIPGGTVTVYATAETEEQLRKFVKATFEQRDKLFRAERDAKNYEELRNGLSALGDALFGNPLMERMLFGPMMMPGFRSRRFRADMPGGENS